MTALEDFAAALFALFQTATTREQLERAIVLLQDFQWCRDGSEATAAMDWQQSPADLAAADAVEAHRGDRDDVHWPTLTHPGSVIWPVVLRVGPATGAAGEELLRAAVVGYEATCAVAAALGPEHGSIYHSTATAGTIGATAATAILLRLPDDRWVDSLGHAFSVLGGSRGALIERSGTRAFHRAHAVRTGIAAARCAAAGLSSTRGDLDRGLGLLAALDVDRLVDLPANALEETSLRVFPTSGWNQTAYEAALVAGGKARDQVRAIEVEVPSAVSAASTGSDPRAERFDSVEWAVAEALSSIAETGAEDLVGLVTVSERAAGAWVRVVTDDVNGVAELSLPLDHPQRPAAVEELARLKWRRPVADVQQCLGRLADKLTQPASKGSSP